MKDFFAVFINPRFWSAYIMIFLPVILGFFMVGTVYLKEKINDFIRRFEKGK